MRTRSLLLAGVVGAMLASAAPRATLGQRMPEWYGPVPAVEGFYTQVRFDGYGGPVSADGVGAKLTWAATHDPEDVGTWRDRLALGVLATYTPQQDLGFSTAQLSGVADLRPLAQPIGRIDPFVSLGAGTLRTNVAIGHGGTSARTPLAVRSNTAFVLTPGVGARLFATPTFAVQGDVRDLVVFRDGARHNPAFTLGVRVRP
jgi:hypothetical protein